LPFSTGRPGTISLGAPALASLVRDRGAGAAGSPGRRLDGSPRGSLQ